MAQLCGKGLLCYHLHSCYSTCGIDNKCILIVFVTVKCFLLPFYYTGYVVDVTKNIVKLRCCNHKLEIETGRYAGIERSPVYMKRQQNHLVILTLQSLKSMHSYRCLDSKQIRNFFVPFTLCKKASNHHANLPLEMYSFTL